jgi:hypothetical protein
MSDANAVLALKNAWNSLIATSERMRELAPGIEGLSDASGLADLDLETYHNVALAQANAAMALRGLVEQLRRLRERESGDAPAA